MKVVANRSRPKSKPTGISVVPCLHCGRIWVKDGETETDECPHCGEKLHPNAKTVEVGKELRLPDGYEARVSQDKLLQETAHILQSLINQTTCDCTKGYQCKHCQAILLLRDFPGPEEGSFEDDWALLRGRPPKRHEPLNEPTDEDKKAWERRLSFADSFEE